jgi:hypothetical protein
VLLLHEKLRNIISLLICLFWATRWSGYGIKRLKGQLCSWHGFPYIRGWMQMVLAPNDLFSWNNNTWNTALVQVNYSIADWCTMTLTLCMIVPWSHDGVVFLALRHFLRLLSSPVRTQLMLIVPCWGPWSPHPQSGVPSPRVHTYSPPRVRNKLHHFELGQIW